MNVADRTGSQATAASDLAVPTGCLREGADMDDQEQDSINRELMEFAIQESMKEVKKSAQTSRFDPGLSNPDTILTELKEIFYQFHLFCCCSRKEAPSEAFAEIMAAIDSGETPVCHVHITS